ncbi:MAG TPA: sigma 54-interacting transcriptional regulator [Spirochaetia bacterium]|nr:sigma 54-interacting transcriptional regulator [Spirochaetia bacterium]
MSTAQRRRPVSRKPLEGRQPSGVGAELSLLLEISQILDSSLDLRAVAGPVLQRLARSRGADSAALTLLSRHTGEIVVEAAHGLSAGQKARGRYRVGEGVTGLVIQEGERAIVARTSEDPRFLDRTGARRARGRDSSFICVPIMKGREVLGALSIDRPVAEAAVLLEEARILAVVGTLIAQAVKLRQAAREEQERLRQDNQRLQDELEDGHRPAGIVGSSPEMRAVYRLVSQVSRSDATVLLRGENGTGKELAARAIHSQSPRRERPFVTVSCAALSEGLIGSELFGHEKGAFTGAVTAKKGRFELADGGTLFLDEVGDLSPAVQVMLLRVLQEREFERVGGSATIRTNVRVIASTSRPLEALTESGQFRLDLYYRLAVFPIHLPPLRERRTDILLLADHFVERACQRSGKTVRRISTPAIDLLMSYDWPGNVRELENCIERAVLLSDDEVIHGHHLPPPLRTRAPGMAARLPLADELANVEQELLVEALKYTRGNVTAAAATLGVTTRVFRLRIRRYQIPPRRFR